VVRGAVALFLPSQEIQKNECIDKITIKQQNSCILAVPFLLFKNATANTLQWVTPITPSTSYIHQLN